MKSRSVLFGIAFFVAAGCGKSELKPVDIYPEDICSFCRMAISDQSFAAEIISDNDRVLKFDDIGCMEEFVRNSKDLKVTATFLKEYETKGWILAAKSIVVRTSIATPMSSGKIAVADSLGAAKYLKQFPVEGSAALTKEQ